MVSFVLEIVYKEAAATNHTNGSELNSDGVSTNAKRRRFTKVRETL
jgi:hypothetical protein